MANMNCKAKGTVQWLLPAESCPIPLTSPNIVLMAFSFIALVILVSKVKESQTEQKPKPSSLLCPSGLPTALWQKSLLPGHWLSEGMDFWSLGGPTNTYLKINLKKINVETFLVQWQRTPGVDPPIFFGPLHSVPQGHWDYILRHSFLHKPWKARVLQLLQAGIKHYSMTMDDELYDVIHLYINNK